MLMTTYTIKDGGGGLLCHECKTITTSAFDIELRRCAQCGYWHLPHLKPTWAKQELEMAVVEAAMELAEARAAAEFGPVQIMTKRALERFDAATSELEASCEGAWSREGA